MNTLRTYLLVVIAAISTTPTFAQSVREDVAGFLLRKSLGEESSYPFLDHDGLSFAQRELLYGFTVDPALLQGTFAYFEYFDFRANGFDFENYDSSLKSRVEIALFDITHEWMTVDEFHRGLASIADDFATSPGVYFGMKFSIDVSLENVWVESLQQHVSAVVFDLHLLE